MNQEFGPRFPVRFDKKNADGWFRIDLRTGWIKRAEVSFKKPKKTSGTEQVRLSLISTQR